MSGTSFVAIGIASIAAVVEGAVWNSPLLFGNARLRLAGLSTETSRPPIGQLLAEIVRQGIAVTILAYLLALTYTVTWLGAVQLAALLWLGFQAVAIVGGVIWEKMPLALFGIHAGDALVKILIVASILSAWR